MPQFPVQDVNQFYALIYGGYGYDACAAYLSVASGIVQGGNPVYAIADFLAMYPKFFGVPVILTGTFAAGSNQVSIGAGVSLAAAPALVYGRCAGANPGSVFTVTGAVFQVFVNGIAQRPSTSTQALDYSVVSTIANGIIVSTITLTFTTQATDTVDASTASSANTCDSGIASGQLVACQALNSGTVITAVNTGVNANSLTISAPATASGSFPLTVYVAPIAPLVVIQLYLNVANASLQSGRWREWWQLAMGLYVAHYCTLYIQTEGNAQSNASQIVANSLQAGITISQGADGVNQGLKDLAAIESWGAWSLTGYGVQLATMGRVVGAGAVYLRA